MMYWKSDNLKIMIKNKVNKVIEKHFQSLLSRYQIRFETSIKCSDFVFDCVHLLYYKCHKINPNRFGWYINYSNWIKTKKKSQQ